MGSFGKYLFFPPVLNACKDNVSIFISSIGLRFILLSFDLCSSVALTIHSGQMGSINPLETNTTDYSGKDKIHKFYSIIRLQLIPKDKACRLKNPALASWFVTKSRLVTTYF